MTCAAGTEIALVSDVYATNCNPTSCPNAIDGMSGGANCADVNSCTVVLSNGICGVDPCPGTPKSWSVTITCN
jgi:hypothetical protein